MKTYKKDGKIVFEFPFMDECGGDEHYGCGGVPYFVGLIVPLKSPWEDDFEMGFAPTIDMCYKGKSYQHGEIVVRWYGEKEEFITLCQELGLDIEEYEKCANCKGPIYGCAVSSMKLNEAYGGPVCSVTCDKLPAPNEK
jgi:hypothetical protein